MRTFIVLIGFLWLGMSSAQHEGDVVVGGEFVMRIRAASGGLSVKDRVQIVENRLIEILGKTDLKSADVRWKQVKNHYEVWVQDVLLITVTPEDAKAAKMSAKQLVEHWTKALKEKLPKLNVKPNP